MKTYRLEFTQKIPADLESVWNFFSSPFNLSDITPKNMTFEVTSPITPDAKMYPGMIVTYKVSPLFGIKLNWMTEITQVKDKVYFIDEQRFGPFAFWHHNHHFETIEGGVLMHDILHYAIGWGPIGSIVNTLMVQKKIMEIFNFRYKTVEEHFGKYQQ